MRAITSVQQTLLSCKGRVLFGNGKIINFVYLFKLKLYNYV